MVLGQEAVGTGGLVQDQAAAAPEVPRDPGLNNADRRASKNAEDNPAPACEEPWLAQAREAIVAQLRDTCARCHTPDGETPVQTHITDVTDIDGLVDVGMIIPGDPDASPVLKRLESDTMPPPGVGPRATDVEVQRLRHYISCLAAPEPPPAEFVLREQQLWQMRKDLEESYQLNEQRFVRYITLAHLHNAGAAEDKLETYRHALTKLVNSLSWKAKVTPAQVVGEGGLLLRIDLRDYGWDEAPVTEQGLGPLTDVWTRIEARYPYANIIDDNPDAEYLYDFTQTQVPFVEGDWLAATASMPPLYHEILGLPETTAGLETLLGVDIAEDIELGNVARAGFVFSKVSVNNRVIERHELGLSANQAVLGDYNGALWVSYDFADNQGVQNIFQHPVDFVHDGNEMIFSLPNGLQAYLITNAQGQRIDEAPSDVVSDSWSAPPVVTNGRSCMGCHYGGMRPATDEIRDIVLSYEKQYPQAVIGDVVKLYPKDDVFQSGLDADRARFEQAMTIAGIPLAKERAEEPITRLADTWDGVMSLAQVAAAVGLSVQALAVSPGLARLKGARAELANLVDKGGVLKRQLFDESFRDIVCFLELGKPLSRAGGTAGCAVARLCNTETGLQGDVTLRIDGVELQALEGKCSPCRSLPVGAALTGELTVLDVQQVTTDGGQLSNKVVVQLKTEVALDLADESESLLTLKPVVSSGMVVSVALVAEAIESPLTCDDVP